MNWLGRILLKRFAHITAQAEASIANSTALREQVEATEPAVTAEHGAALEKLEQATERSRRLAQMNTRNHYSESLTHAFRGRPKEC